MNSDELACKREAKIKFFPDKQGHPCWKLFIQDACEEKKRKETKEEETRGSGHRGCNPGAKREDLDMHHETRAGLWGEAALHLAARLRDENT